MTYINILSQLLQIQQLSKMQTTSDLSRWISCLVLVTFDLDQGQKIQHIVPSVQFSPATLKQIAMLSFPDSHSFNDYENLFKYTYKLYNGMFGYVCFKQKKDPSNARGFSQKSLVIISELPFVYFFQRLCEFIVFKTFNTVAEGDYQQVMQRICQQIKNWPDPIPKSAYILPVLDYQLAISIPNYKVNNRSLRSKNGLLQPSTVKNQQSSKSPKSPSSPSSIVYPSRQALKDLSKEPQLNLQTILTQQQLLKQGTFQQIKICQLFLGFQQLLWPIWEKVMLNKSVVLIGTNPQQVSHAVLGAVSLIYPFQYYGYYNPYVTVYDPNLEKISNQANYWISGATNPLFSKLFPKTPLIMLSASSKCPKHIRAATQILLKPATLNPPSSPFSFSIFSSSPRNSASNSNSSSSSTSQQKQAINESVVRKYFYQLSSSVQKIIDGYFEQQQNDLKIFEEVSFLKWLKEREKKQLYGFQDFFNGNQRKCVMQFFGQFVNTGNFSLYLASRNAIKFKNK